MVVAKNFAVLKKMVVNIWVGGVIIVHLRIMSFVNLYYHIVFATKNREQTIVNSVERRVYELLYAVMKNMNCKVFRIGGMPDHVHIFVEIPPTLAVATFVKELKRESSVVIRDERIIPNWGGWQDGYGAFSYSIHESDKIINYIKNQKEHHRHVSFVEEYRAWLIENGVDESAPYFPR